jgi:hypothetical protein
MTFTFLYRASSVNELLYVGIAADPLARFKQHETAPWFPLVASVAGRWFPDRKAAAAVEREAIRTEVPRWNRGLSPDREAAAMRHLEAFQLKRKANMARLAELRPGESYFSGPDHYRKRAHRAFVLRAVECAAAGRKPDPEPFSAQLLATVVDQESYLAALAEWQGIEFRRRTDYLAACDAEHASLAFP